MVQAIRDQWVIGLAVIVMVVSFIIWRWARR